MKTITSKSELTRMITQIIKEELAQGGTNLNMQGNYQQGQQKALPKGQAAGQATKQAAQTVGKVVKEFVVNYGRAQWSVISFGPFVMWTNGKAAFKINNQVHKFLLQALGSVLKVSSAAQAGLSNIAWNGLKTAGIERNEFFSVAMGEARALGDGFKTLLTEICKTLVDKTMVIYGAFLAALWASNPIFAMYESDIKNLFQSATAKLKVGWEEAKKFGKQALSQLQAYAQQKFNQAKAYGQQKLKQATNLGKSALNTASNYAGQAVGAAKGFFQGLFEALERMLSFKSDTFSGLMVEVRYISRGILL